jgi:hypothetical protein
LFTFVNKNRTEPNREHPYFNPFAIPLQIINLFGQSIRTVEFVPANPQVNSQQSATFWLWKNGWLRITIRFNESFD